MKRKLNDKIVWITGAGSGIGQNAAVTLSKLGMKVILSGRNIENLQETALELFLEDFLYFFQIKLLSYQV